MALIVFANSCHDVQVNLDGGSSSGKIPDLYRNARATSTPSTPTDCRVGTHLYRQPIRPIGL
jgi:hypothetical protein